MSNEKPGFDELHMREAVRLSREGMADGRGGPFGAVVVRDGEIISRGANRVVRSHDPTAHAEVVAIRGACEALGTHVLEGCEIYSSCEPCPMCMAAIYWSRIERVWYAGTHADATDAGFDDSLIYEQIKLPVEARSLPMIQRMRDAALEVFDEWKRSPVKVHY
jgi:guanine deaminase